LPSAIEANCSIENKAQVEQRDKLNPERAELYRLTVTSQSPPGYPGVAAAKSPFLPAEPCSLLRPTQVPAGLCFETHASSQREATQQEAKLQPTMRADAKNGLDEMLAKEAL